MTIFFTLSKNLVLLIATEFWESWSLFTERGMAEFIVPLGSIQASPSTVPQSSSARIFLADLKQRSKHDDRMYRPKEATEVSRTVTDLYRLRTGTGKEPRLSPDE
jgi:hypothetical protein